MTPNQHKSLVTRCWDALDAETPDNLKLMRDYAFPLRSKVQPGPDSDEFIDQLHNLVESAYELGARPREASRKNLENALSDLGERNPRG